MKSGAKERVRWGILGTGRIVKRRFIPGMAESKEAVTLAIASRNEAKANAFAQEYGIERAYGSYEALLADPEIQAVYLPLPNDLHAEWAIRSARAGKHVLSEKPLGVSAEQCREMINACENAGVLLMEGFMYRFHPRTKKIKKIVSNGEIGDPVVIHVSSGYRLERENDIRLQPREGAGALLDAGCYSVNISRYLFGAEPVAVFGQARIKEDCGCDITFTGMLEFPCGGVSLFDASFETSYKQLMQVSGTTGTLLVEKPFVPGTGSMPLTILRQDADPEQFTVQGADQFALEIDHFSACIRSGSKPELAPSDAVGNLKVMDALKESAKTGKRILLSEKR